MFVIQINEVDSSCHSLLEDAEIQKQRFIDSGIDPETIEIGTKDTFEPAQD